VRTAAGPPAIVSLVCETCNSRQRTQPCVCRVARASSTTWCVPISLPRRYTSCTVKPGTRSVHIFSKLSNLRSAQDRQTITLAHLSSSSDILARVNGVRSGRSSNAHCRPSDMHRAHGLSPSQPSFLLPDASTVSPCAARRTCRVKLETLRWTAGREGRRRVTGDRRHAAIACRAA